MDGSQFPTLLKKKATLMGSITRFDLTIVGGTYLILSWMKVSGFMALIVNLVVLIILKGAQKLVMPGFWTHLRGPKILSLSTFKGDGDE